MKHQEIRKAFTGHFENLNHSHVDSSSLIPHNDPTLLFTNAGMNQFKNVFLGSESLPFNRAVTIQKCVRAGGKHNDLENVGYTTRHHTFFEMLGNFSFGDYFKKEAIHYAWDLLTNKLGIPKDKLYVTVFETDDEAAEIWHKQEGVPKDRIHRMGEKDNFWRMGDTGPCGPCSEIFYDHGPAAAIDPKAAFPHDENRYVEIWNLVFMQYYEDATGLTPLPKPSVDTGAGLERIAALMQGHTDNYQTDLFAPLIKKTAEISGLKYSDWEKDASTKATYKVIADHARATSFLMADGVLPSNEGRGYVLRRIMRRALRYGQKFTDNPQLFKEVCAVVISEMNEFYPNLQQNRSTILQAVEQETLKFLSTLTQGTQILEEHLRALKAKGQTTVEGKTAFKLYDTFGFPIDLTQLIAKEQNFQVNLTEFDQEFEKARQKAKQARKSHSLAANDQHLVAWTKQAKDLGGGATEFVGYSHTLVAQQIPLGLSNGQKDVTSLNEGESGLVIFRKTPFYAEGGGQIGDQGEITDGSAVAEVFDCTKMNDQFIHHIVVKSGTFKADQTYNLQVQHSSRRETAKNHSATHLMHAALKKILGHHVGQAGSLVSFDKLRFDFSHTSAVTPEQIAEIENLVNEQILAGLPVKAQQQSYKEAVQQGAVAMFGEKYGDEVRVLTMGDFSKELCGGIHVNNTSEIGFFKIVSESSVSAGVRRIEALTGQTVFNYLKKNTQENIRARKVANLSIQWESYLDSEEPGVDATVVQLQTQVQQFKKQIQGLQSQSLDVDGIIKNAHTIASSAGDIRLVIEDAGVEDRNVLSDMVDKLRDKGQNLVVVLVGGGAAAKPFLIACNKNLKNINCGDIAKNLSQTFGGKGGGRPDYAQGSFERFDAAKALEIVKTLIK
jgi:alanyl-tRNA synthetase